MNETLKVLEERRSCRNFKPDMITDEELKEKINQALIMYFELY